MTHTHNACNQKISTHQYEPLIHVMRGGLVESIHFGALAIMRPNGEIIMQLGNISQPVFPRSAIKLFQAIPLVEYGAADLYKFSDAELSLACASHSGEPQHVATALSMLMKAGLQLDDLECGAHAPTRKSAAQALAIAGQQPSVLHNNCSGKHIGMLATAKHLGMPLKGYTAIDHPLQILIRNGLSQAAGFDLSNSIYGVDGCSVPTWSIPLENLALAFARIGSGQGVALSQFTAADRLIEAVWNNPFLVGGTKRFDTDIMQELHHQVFTKVGAEGIYCGYFPASELGVAIKCADGSERGANAIMAAIIQSVLAMPKEIPDILKSHLQPKLTNWSSIKVGEIQPSNDFIEQLIDQIIQRL